MDRRSVKAYTTWLQKTIQRKKENLSDEDVRKILVGQCMLPAKKMDFELIDACVDYFDPEIEGIEDPRQVETLSKILRRISSEDAASEEKKISRKGQR